jgi:hypothetical protein
MSDEIRNPKSEGDDSGKPTITEKEVTWYEHVAAHVARHKANEQSTNEAARISAALRLPLKPRVNVAGMELEPLHYRMSLLLEELRFPLEVGGKTTEGDLALALLCFSDRELVEALSHEHGAETARRVLCSAACVADVQSRITTVQMRAFVDFLKQQYGLREGEDDTPGKAAAAVTA